MNTIPPSLLSLYTEWREDRWRKCVDGSSPPQPAKEGQLIGLIYEGARKNQIARCGFNHLKINAVMGWLQLFLSEHPFFPPPQCACGDDLWHHTLCSVHDTYHAAATAKGRETRSRESREKQADVFFQTTDQARTMSTTLTVPVEISTIQQQAKTFSELIQRGIDAWSEAGRLLVQMLEENPESRSIILESCPDITEEILSRFEAIGRKQIHPRTLLNNSPGMRRLRSLPYSEQERYLTHPIPLLIKTERGPETLNVAIKNLTPAQAQQAFCRDGVRAPEAQRAWLESRKAKIMKNGQPFEIKGNKVIFHGHCEMTAKELAQVLAKMS